MSDVNDESIITESFEAVSLQSLRLRRNINGGEEPHVNEPEEKKEHEHGEQEEEVDEQEEEVDEQEEEEVGEQEVEEGEEEPRDQYPTPVGVIKALLLVIGGFIHEAIHASGGLPVFDPASGFGTIHQVLYDWANIPVIEQDKFGPEPKDYLTTMDPRYSFLITHAPTWLKFAFLEKAFLSGKPFAILLPILSLATVTASLLFERYPMTIYLFRRNVLLNIDGERKPYHMAWYVGNLGEKEEFTKLFYIDSVDIEDEIEDEDI
jgi:hypothetical protein